jgi:hypothetical protein
MRGRMHRRSSFLAAVAVLAAGAFAATPARADQTLGLGQPAAVDGVVVAWEITGAAGQTLQLRSVQALGGGGSATTAISADTAVTASPQAFAARQPLAAGGTLALAGATGSPTVSATVEPDADGDGWGDTTQDACPGNAADHAAPCDPTTTFGSPLHLQPDTRSLTGGPYETFQNAAAGTTPAAPAAGVLVRWRLRADPAKADTVLQLVRPTTPGGGTYAVIAESDPVRTTDDGVVTLPAQIAVQQGDRLALRSVTRGAQSVSGALAFRNGDAMDLDGTPRTAGQTWTPDTSTPNAFRLLIQADVEPDANADGRGDVTQEHADLRVTGSATAEAAVTEPWGQGYTVRNDGPDDALGVVVTLGGPGAMASGPGCAPGGTTCAVGTIKAGAAVTISAGFAIPTIYPPPSGTYTSTATATAVTDDPDLKNNSATLTTVTRPVGGGIVPVPRPPGLCANVVRGTRDDNVLRGTIFGDRLVGDDGDDLLKGLAGADCLEGGTGNDVLDGGDGDDRLSGASGRDRLTGGNGADKLTGGRGNDRLNGGNGDDTLSPGAGHDAIAGGAGNDTINSVDGVRETVDCGKGRDTVRADRRDRLKGCEKVTRKR